MQQLMWFSCKQCIKTGDPDFRSGDYERVLRSEAYFNHASSRYLNDNVRSSLRLEDQKLILRMCRDLVAYNSVNY